MARTSSAASTSPAAEPTSGTTATATAGADPVPANAARFSDDPTSGTSSQAHATPPMAAATTGGSVSVACSSWACQRRSPIVARRASVMSRVQAVSSSDSSRTSAPKPAAVVIPSVRAVCAACGTGDVVSAARAAARNVTDAPGSARLTSARSRAVSSPGPATSRTFGTIGLDAACAGTTTTTPVATPAASGRLGTPVCPASRIVIVLPPKLALLPPTLTLAGAVPTSGAAALVAIAGTTAPDWPPYPDSAASGNRGPGAAATTAAYWAGSTNITDSSVPAPSEPASSSAAAVETTPGTEEIWACSPAGIAPLDGAAMIASAPTCCQDSATWLRVTAVLTMAGNATMASTSTRANAGKTVPGGVRVARVRPTNATTPRVRPAILASSRARRG